MMSFPKANSITSVKNAVNYLTTFDFQNIKSVWLYLHVASDRTTFNNNMLLRWPETNS